MRKITIAVITLLLITSGFALIKQQQSGSTPETRCRKRMENFGQLIKDNKEVEAVFSGLIGAFAALNPDMHPKEVVQRIVQALINSCMADEKSKIEV
jgi:hypothetical protein